MISLEHIFNPRFIKTKKGAQYYICKFCDKELSLSPGPCLTFETQKDYEIWKQQRT